MRKGKPYWIPPSVIEELENVKANGNITGNANGFREMARHCSVGREVEHIRSKMFPFIEKQRRKK